MPTITQKQDSISVYQGELTVPVIIEITKAIKQAFPGLSDGFHDLLQKRAKENKFSDQRILDAVKYVIDTCRYPTPTVADFISFDKRIKLFTYMEMCEMVNSFGSGVWDKHKAITIDGVKEKRWINISEAKQFNFNI